MLYICTKFYKISQKVSELFSSHDFHSEISKGHNSIQNIDGIRVLFLCTSSDDALHLYKIS